MTGSENIKCAKPLHDQLAARRIAHALISGTRDGSTILSDSSRRLIENALLFDSEASIQLRPRLGATNFGGCEMTPMRQAFVEVLLLLEQPKPLSNQAKITRLLFLLIDRARDPEESGSAAQFAAAAMIYLEALESKSAAVVEVRRDEMNVQAL